MIIFIAWENKDEFMVIFGDNCDNQQLIMIQ
jgi:hypothetical protein